MGVGIVGTRRLMDVFELDSLPGRGTEVTLGKRLPKGAPTVTPAMLSRIGKELAATGASDPLVEVRMQNQS